MSKSWASQVNFPEAIKKEQTGLYHGMLEFFLDEL